MKNTDELITLCHNIRALCRRHNISISDLSQKTGIALDILENAEKNVVSNGFTVDTLLDLCRFFHKTPASFFIDDFEVQA